MSRSQATLLFRVISHNQTSFLQHRTCELLSHLFITKPTRDIAHSSTRIPLGSYGLDNPQETLLVEDLGMFFSFLELPDADLAEVHVSVFDGKRKCVKSANCVFPRTLWLQGPDKCSSY